MIVINKLYELHVDKGTILNRNTKFSGYIGANEIQLLTYFLERPNEIMPKKELLDHVWTSRGVVVEESSLMNAISNCRKLLDDKSGKIIKTKRGEGYCFVGEVEYMHGVESGSKASSNVRMIGNFSSIGLDLLYGSIKPSLLFISLFLTSLTTMYFIMMSSKESLESAEHYLTSTFQKCSFYGKGSIERTYKFPRIYTFNGVSILIDEDFNSISYPTGFGGIHCE
ncbi:hypothetical protein BA953_23680 [Vibrio coralliilyticus]|nr:helix-turn-helix domain-containing protein [Vibrio coralliilyticus]ANW27123.1 hypothetical protein BA953_23680 [Vibrio coralliilyticus]